MKKIILSILFISIVLAANAQNKMVLDMSQEAPNIRINAAKTQKFEVTVDERAEARTAAIVAQFPVSAEVRAQIFQINRNLFTKMDGNRDTITPEMAKELRTSIMNNIALLMPREQGKRFAQLFYSQVK